MANLTKRPPPDRSKIDVSDANQLKRWCKTLNVSKEDLLRAVETVGNAAAAVRKELETRPERKPLKPDDFPVDAQGTAVVAQDGRPIAETSSPVVAEDVAGRLNNDEARREEDKWSA
jgi:uncharacterized protein DUF3606